MTSLNGKFPPHGGSSEFTGLYRGKYGNLWVGGWVIPNLDPAIAEAMEIPAQYRSVGIITSRSASMSVCVAADEAVKTADVHLVHLEMTTDSNGKGPRCAFLVLGGEDVSDVRRAVQVTMDALPHTFGGMGVGETAGYDVHWSANPGEVLCHPYFGAVSGKAWGFLDGWPKAVGMIMADYAMKSAAVELIHVHTSEENHWHNEYTCSFTGSSGDVLAAVRKAREVGEHCIRATGNLEPVPQGDPYY